MNYIVINKLVTKSIYKQIADSITEAIESGVLRYNDRLPTEKELCKLFSISQTAVKMAYEKLISEGKIVRIKGKGTYVTNRSIYQAKLHSYYAFEVDHQRFIKNTILIEKSNKDMSAIRELQLESNEYYLHMVNLYSSSKNPKLIQHVFLSHTKFKDYEELSNVEESIYDFLEKSNYKINDLRTTFTTINASAADALLLNLKQDDAIYLVRTKIVDEHGKTICYTCNYYPGNFTEFEVTVHAI